MVVYEAWWDSQLDCNDGNASSVGKQYLRNGVFDRGSLCVELGAFLPQARIFDALVKRIEQKNDIAPCHEVVEVCLPGVVELLDDLGA